MIFLEIETVFASKIWARYWGNLAGNPHWDLNWSRFAMWDCLLVFLQGGHSNYWRQTRRTIYCFPRCHWTTLPLFALFGLKIQLLYQQISWVLGWNVLLNKKENKMKQSVGHPSYVHIYATYEFEHVCHPILASGTRSAPKSAFSRPVWILGGAAVS